MLNYPQRVFNTAFISPALSGCFESSSTDTGHSFNWRSAFVSVNCFSCEQNSEPRMLYYWQQKKSHSQIVNAAVLLVNVGSRPICECEFFNLYGSICFTLLAFISTKRSGRMASRSDDSILFRQYAPTISQHAGQSLPWRSQAEAKECTHAARVTNTKPT